MLLSTNKEINKRFQMSLHTIRTIFQNLLSEQLSTPIALTYERSHQQEGARLCRQTNEQTHGLYICVKQICFNLKIKHNMGPNKIYLILVL